MRKKEKKSLELLLNLYINKGDERRPTDIREGRKVELHSEKAKNGTAYAQAHVPSIFSTR